MKKVLKLIILILQQKGIISAKEFADLLEEIKNAATTNFQRNRGKEDGVPRHQKTLQKHDRAN